MKKLLSMALMLSDSHPSLALALANLRFKLTGQKCLFYRRNDGILAIRCGESFQLIPDLRRGLHLYRNGLSGRIDEISLAYCLSEVEFQVGDVVIDCGANFGDLASALHQFGVKVIMFEPSVVEASLLSKRYGTDLVHQIGLSDVTGVKPFYLSSSSGDSSIHQPADGYDAKTEIHVTRLDDIGLEDQEVKLLKVEAEGHEPEVLRGALGVLGRVEFVAIDGGGERGALRETTFEECANILTSAGFRLLSMSTSRHFSGIFQRVNVQRDQDT